MPARSLSIVLPAYNEEDRLGPALDELFGYLHRRGARAATAGPGASELPESIQVLVVDDGSTDGTAALVRARPEAIAGELELLTVPHGGKGAAVRAGMVAATGEVVLFADADMATPPDEIPLAGRRARDRRRRVRQPDPARRLATCAPRSPRGGGLLGKTFHALASLWVVGPVQDTQCGFKGFRRDVARDVFARQKVTSIVFDVEVIFLVRRRGYTSRRRARSAGPTAAARACTRACGSRSRWRGTCSGSRCSTATSSGSPAGRAISPRPDAAAGRCA